MFEITDDFLAQAGFGLLSGDAKERMRRNVETRVDTKIKSAVIAAVDEEELDAFERLLDGDDAPALLNWCQENGVNLVEIVQTAMNETMAELQMLHNDAMQSIQQ